MKWISIRHHPSPKHVKLFAVPEHNLRYYEGDHEYVIGDECFPTLFDVIRVIDEELESGNYHGSVGMSFELSKIIARHTGDMKITTAILLEIYESSLFMR